MNRRIGLQYTSFGAASDLQGPSVQMKIDSQPSENPSAYLEICKLGDKIAIGYMCGAPAMTDEAYVTESDLQRLKI